MAAKIKIIDLVYKTTKPLSQIIADAVNEMSVVTKDDGHQVYVRVTDVDQNRVILINDCILSKSILLSLEHKILLTILFLIRLSS